MRICPEAFSTPHTGSKRSGFVTAPLLRRANKQLLPDRYFRSMTLPAAWGLTISISVLPLSPGPSSRQVSTLTALAAAVYLGTGSGLEKVAAASRRRVST